MYGRMKIGDTMWVWDHVKDEPVREKDMSEERWAASEKKKWEAIKEQLNTKPMTIIELGAILQDTGLCVVTSQRNGVLRMRVAEMKAEGLREERLVSIADWNDTVIGAEYAVDKHLEEAIKNILKQQDQ